MTTNQHSTRSGWTARSALTTLGAHRAAARARRAARVEQRRLAAELAVFDSPADLIELAATLARYDDSATEDIRRSVDWSRAA